MEIREHTVSLVSGPAGNGSDRTNHLRPPAGRGNGWSAGKLSACLAHLARSPRISGIGFNLACLILENIQLSSQDLNQAYFDCARAVNRAKALARRAEVALAPGRSDKPESRQGRVRLQDRHYERNGPSRSGRRSCP